MTEHLRYEFTAIIDKYKDVTKTLDKLNDVSEKGGDISDVLVELKSQV